MCRLFVFVVCVLLAYSIVEAYKGKPVGKYDHVLAAATHHLGPAIIDVKIDKIGVDKIPNKVKENDAKLTTGEILSHVNQQAKKQMDNDTMESIPTVEQVIETFPPELQDLMDFLRNTTDIELCVYRIPEYEGYEIGFVCEPGYCASGVKLCDHSEDCSYFNDEIPQLCNQPAGLYETYGCPIKVYDYWGEEYWMYTTIDASSVCDGFEDCADGSDEEECYADWYSDMSNDTYVDYSNHTREVDNENLEEPRQAIIPERSAEQAYVRSNPMEKLSKKAKDGKQDKRHVPSVVKKTENTPNHK